MQKNNYEDNEYLSKEILEEDENGEDDVWVEIFKTGKSMDMHHKEGGIENDDDLKCIEKLSTCMIESSIGTKLTSKLRLDENYCDKNIMQDIGYVPLSNKELDQLFSPKKLASMQKIYSPVKRRKIKKNEINNKCF